MKKRSVLFICILLLLLSGCSGPLKPLTDGFSFRDDVGELPDAVSPTALTSAPTEIFIPEPDPTPTIPDESEENEVYRYTEEEPVYDPMWVILDMDYFSDVDDVCALRIADMMHREGIISLKAVMACSDDPRCPKAIRAQLLYDGLSEVPVGKNTERDPVPVSDSPYWEDLISFYPSEVEDTSYPDAYDLYLSVLEEASSEGKKVRIITTGFLNNLAALLSDTEYGRELFRNNVDDLYITGGELSDPGHDFNFCYNSATKNAANYVCDHIPPEVRTVYSTYYSVERKGGWIRCGGPIREYAPSDPVAVAFEDYFRYAPHMAHASGQIAWDPFCVWCACLNDNPAAGKRTTHTYLHPLYMYIDPSGANYLSTEREPRNDNTWVLLRHSAESEHWSLLYRFSGFDDFSWYEDQLNYWINLGIRP